MEIISHYLDNKEYMKELSDLSEMIFHFRMDDWQKKGILGKNYHPFSVIEDGKLVANVTANTYDALIGKRKVLLVQLGTIMTHPDYRGKGYIKKLMGRVLNEYSNAAFVFLYANEEAVAMYPKFGFILCAEKQYCYSLSALDAMAGKSDFRPLDLSKKKNRDILRQYANQRIAISNQFSLLGDASPRLIHMEEECFTKSVYVSDALGALIVLTTSSSDKKTIRLNMVCFKDAIVCEDEYSKRMNPILASIPALVSNDQITNLEVCFSHESSAPLVSTDGLAHDGEPLFIRANVPLLMPGMKVIFSVRPSDMDPLDLRGFRLSCLDYTK